MIDICIAQSKHSGLFPLVSSFVNLKLSTELICSDKASTCWQGVVPFKVLQFPLY